MMKIKLDFVDINLPYDFACSNVELSFYEVQFGINCGILLSVSAIKRAVDELEININSSEAITELAYKREGDDIKLLLEMVVEQEGRQNENLAYDKFLYLCLLWVYNNRHRYNNTDRILSHIYGDFGYPEEMLDFVIYPYNEGAFYEDSWILENWEKYLKREHEKYSSRIS